MIPDAASGKFASDLVMLVIVFAPFSAESWRHSHAVATLPPIMVTLSGPETFPEIGRLPGNAGRRSRSTRCCATLRYRNSSARRSASFRALLQARRHPYTAHLAQRVSATSRVPVPEGGRTIRPTELRVSTALAAPLQLPSTRRVSVPPFVSAIIPAARRSLRPELKCPPVGLRPASVAA